MKFSMSLHTHVCRQIGRFKSFIYVAEDAYIHTNEEENKYAGQEVRTGSVAKTGSVLHTYQ